MEAEEVQKKKAQEPRKPNKKECPLCGVYINTVDALPVLINGIDERFEKPVVGEDVVLQLVYRPASKILPLPAQQKDQFQGNIPWVNENSTPETFTNDNPCSQYARIMKGGLAFVRNSFLKEIQDIEIERANDKLLYDFDDGTAKAAIDYIKMNLDVMEESFGRSERESTPAPRTNDLNDDLKRTTDASTKLSDITEGVANLNVSHSQDYDDGFYFYQSDANSKAKFFLSKLDQRILVALLGEDRSIWPTTIKARLENINYDLGVVDAELVHRFKYLGHLPFGTEVAFLELDWFEEPEQPRLAGSHDRPRRSSKNKRSILPPEVFKEFSKALLERSKRSSARRQREDKDKRRFEKNLELKTLEFYSSENNIPLTDYGYQVPHKEINQFDQTLSSLMAEPTEETAAEPVRDTRAKTKTVWGTDILAPVEDPLLQEDDGWDAELLIQQAKAAQTGKNKKKKQLKVLFSSSLR